HHVVHHLAYRFPASREPEDVAPESRSVALVERLEGGPVASRGGADEGQLFFRRAARHLPHLARWRGFHEWLDGMRLEVFQNAFPYHEARRAHDAPCARPGDLDHRTHLRERSAP